MYSPSVFTVQWNRYVETSDQDWRGRKETKRTCAGFREISVLHCFWHVFNVV